MQSKKYTKRAAMKVKTLSLVLASSCLIYSGVHAAGLGKLTVLSSLGQPLRAEIELTSVARSDVGNLFPKLADHEAFRQANVDFNPTLSSLRFAVEDRGTRHFVLITSSQAFNEPYVELLVELTSGTGRLVREYAMLLDLAEMKSNYAAANGENAAPAVGKSNSISTPNSFSNKPIAAIISPVKPETNPAPDKGISPVSKQDSSQNSTRTSTRTSAAYYQIKSGDTLGKIAEKFKYPGVSLDQMLVALQRNNASAMINDNINLIHSGVILTIPDKNEVEHIDRSEAQKIVIAQSVDFNAYREKLANQVAQGDSEKMAETKKINSGKIAAKVLETPSVVNESKDKLKLSKPQVQGQAEVKKAEEDKIAEQKVREVSTARIKELEQNTAKLQKILELQKEASSLPAQSQTKNTDVANSASTSTELPTIDVNVQTEHKPEQQQIAVAAKPGPDLQQRFFDNWERFLPYGATLLALLAGLGIYLSKRKKKIEQVDDGTMLTDSGKNPASLAKDAEADNSALNSGSVHTATPLAEDEVDPITEADIHIAYGRDEQAEEILKLALCAQPDSQSIRMKLLEIYARRKDIHHFGEAASEFYRMTGGVGPDWVHVAAMGIILDPQNPLYTNEQADNNDAPAPESAPDASSANEAVSAHSESDACPECEKVGLNISPLNFNGEASTVKQAELIQVETSILAQEDNSHLDSAITTPGAIEFDLSGIDLELPKLSPEEEQAKSTTVQKNNVSANSTDKNLDEVLITSSTNISGEMANKLDLAITYQKIGDKDGARELLDEVLKNGNQEQIARAKAMLQELS